MSRPVESKGHLNPGSPGVELVRFPVGAELDEVARHIWVARWELPEGEVSRQRVLMYPSFNLVVMPEGTRLYGPDPRVSVRELTGSGRAVGVLLRPATGRLLGATRPEELVGKSIPIAGAPEREVESVLGSLDDGSCLVSLVRGWLLPLAGEVDEAGRALNQIARAVEEDEKLIRVCDLAERFGLSVRSLERLVTGRVGVTPKWLIECRRLQEAATALREAQVDLTELALRLGFVDYAHFSRRYKEILGETPEQTRATRGAGPRTR